MENIIKIIKKNQLFSGVSEENIKNGRICTLEELRQHINELEEKHANNNIG